MPRLRYIEESEKSPRTRELIESAKRTGARSARSQPDDAQPAGHCLGRILEQAALSGHTATQAQGDVPHQDFGCASMRLLLDRTLDGRKGGRADRGHDQ